MALQSMTGYGRGAASSALLRVEAEVGSVNRRQLDIRVSLSRALASLEPRICAAVQRRLRRGAVSVNFRVAPRDGGGQGARLNLEAARGYIKALRRAAAELRLRDDLTAQALLSIPEVMRYESAADDPEAVWPVMQRALRKALEEAERVRRTEGAALERDLTRRIAALARRRIRIAALAPRVAARLRARLAARLREAGVSASGREPEIMREAALLADRGDISEELTRLESHLAQAGARVAQGGETGRLLDFLCQEMMREINTLGAKAGDVRIANHVLQFKTELERVREQVQNVE
ncbi:MAG: YicC family protein [Lentisphaerae bacterium]|nr:YicC family protein [Lentisphaerota bacterium]